MSRILAAVLCPVLVAAALADGPPPPPKGMKAVPFRVHVATDVESPDYDLFAVTTQTHPTKKSTTRTAQPAKLTPKTPLTFRTYSSFTSIALVAVPKEAAAKYATEAEFLAAVAEGAVPGQVASKTALPRGDVRLIPEKDPRERLVAEFKLTKIDPKEGVVLTQEEDPSPGKERKDCDESDAESLREEIAPRRGGLAAGIASSVAVALTGLWLVRRRLRA